ncbi:LysR family transcriptional regulator [Enterobacterales bacterium AE_CKDN230030158-1A_HGKHYDSX7]
MTSIRQLRYFVVIVECGSFTAAAQSLFVAQSALSRQIRELEQHLGTPLFERTARQPRLTPAGQLFYDRARRLLADLDKAERLSREVGQGLRGSLRLNHSSTVPLVGRLLERIGAYLHDNADVSLEIAQQSSEAQLQDIAEGNLDVGLLRLPVLRQHEGVDVHPLFDEPLYLAVAARHPRARAASVQLAELGEERFISIPHGQRGGLSYQSAALCMQAGFFPRAAQVVSRKTTQLQLIQAGFGVALLPESMRALAHESVVFVPLEGRGCSTTVALACSRAGQEMVQRFVAVMRALEAGEHANPTAG